MPNSNGKVILVDERDRPLGVEDKLAAHQGKGKLHRAFSIFILDSSNRLLLQKRASSKYHCPGLWSNSCCSHPQPGAELLAEAQKRIQFELGFTTALKEIGTARYRLVLENGMTEWELNHLLVGRYESSVEPNPEEVAECKWIAITDLKREVKQHKKIFSPWLPIILPHFLRAVC